MSACMYGVLLKGQKPLEEAHQIIHILSAKQIPKLNFSVDSFHPINSDWFLTVTYVAHKVVLILAFCTFAW